MILNRSWIAFGVVALAGLGCVGERAHYDYESVARARRTETQTAPARQASGAQQAPRAGSAARPAPPPDPSTPNRVTGHELSLAECIDLALEANPDIGAAVARIRQSWRSNSPDDCSCDC